MHESAITSAGRLGGGPAVLGGNDGSYAALFTREGMIGLGVEAGVRGNAFDSDSRERCYKERSEVGDVGLRPTANIGGQDDSDGTV